MARSLRHGPGNRYVRTAPLSRIVPIIAAHHLERAATRQPTSERIVETQKELLQVLDEVLSLGGRAVRTFDVGTPLLGAIPELDSMAVVNLITMLEERFGITVDDDEIGGDTFASVGSLTAFVSAKLAG